MSSNQFVVKPSTITRVLGWMTCLVVLAGAGTQLASRLTGHENMYGLVQIFDLEGERNIPSFFSITLLLIADLLLWIIALLKRRQMAADGSYWAILSFGFLFMAADEASSIHELLERPTRMLLNGGNQGFLYFSWILPATALVLVLALIFLRFLLRLPPNTRFAFLLGAIIYLGGAIGFESIGGRIFEIHGRNLLYAMSSTIEESLEMAGMIIFIRALLVYIGENLQEVKFIFDPNPGQAASTNSRT